MEEPIPPGAGGQQDPKVIGPIVRNFLFKAFQYRVEQVMTGKPHTGQLSPELVEELDAIAKKSASLPNNNAYSLAKYVIERMREQSRIIEPQEKPVPYSDYTRHGDALRKELAELPSVREPAKLAERVRRLFKEGIQGKPQSEVRFLLLYTAVPLAPRVGEAFTVELLTQVPSALLGPFGTPEPPEIPEHQGQLLERSLFFAAHYDRRELVQELVVRFSDMVHSMPEEARFKLINEVGGQCLGSLRKLGMRDEISRFYTRLKAEVLRGMTPQELRKKYAAKPDLWGAVLQTLLNIAAGELTFGLSDQATPSLDEARNELLQPNATKLPPIIYTRLARAYVRALGQCPSEQGLPRIIELFRKMDPSRITNTWTSGPYYSRLHLNLVEEVVLAVVSDEFALGPAGRRWLEDDEYLVRRRIHADMRRHLDKSGL
jgi:hypothetical protein